MNDYNHGNPGNHGMPRHEINTLIIGCMDGRTNFKVDELNAQHGGAIILRNAGANVSAPEMKRAIEIALDKYNIKIIVLIPHIDCGAMGLVCDTLLEHKSADPRVYSDLIQQFKGRFSDRGDLETRLNPDMQFDALKELIGNRQVTLFRYVLDPSGLSVPEDYHKHSHTLFVSRPYTSQCSLMFEDATAVTGKEVGMWGTYVVQPADESSIRIAIDNLGIRRVIFFAESVGDLHEMEHAEKELRSKGVLNGVNVSLVVPKHVKKRMTSL